MAIQQINLGSAPSGAGGDTQRAANTKINQNFSNTTHAASRLVGLASSNLAENKSIVEAFYAHLAGAGRILNSGEVGSDINDSSGPVFYIIGKADAVNPPPLYSSAYLVQIRHGVEGYVSGRSRQTVYSPLTHESWTRVSNLGHTLNTTWTPTGSNKAIYLSTTATNPNVTVNSDGVLQRSSSSEKYKDILTDLELDDEAYGNAMQVKPIIYRSKAELDPKDWHFLSFSAEKLGELEPALTQWKTHETVIDEETGEPVSVELEQKEAEGINLNAICAVLHATNIYQDKKLKELEQRLTALESNNESIE